MAEWLLVLVIATLPGDTYTVADFDNVADCTKAMASR